MKAERSLCVRPRITFCQGCEHNLGERNSSPLLRHRSDESHARTDNEQINSPTAEIPAIGISSAAEYKKIDPKRTSVGILKASGLFPIMVAFH